MDVVQEDARIGDILRSAAALLEKSGVENPLIDAELLLGHCLNKTRTELYISSGDRAAEPQRLLFEDMIARRCRREPVAYILGEREFWSRRFIVTPDVLIPRPETEFLVERALQAATQQGGIERCLDLCCGSGVIGIIVAMETNAQVIASDISGPALSICRKNCVLHGVTDQVLTVEADLASCFIHDTGFDLITANPPYVSRREIDVELEVDVAAYEPHLALDGGSDGLDLIRRIGEAIPFLLKSGGDFFMEIGHAQGANVKELFSAAEHRNWCEAVAVLKDYAGRDRVVHVRRK